MKKKISQEAAMLIEIGKLTGKKAAEENFALGIPIVIEENGYVIEQDKDGQKRKIKKITKTFLGNGN